MTRGGQRGAIRVQLTANFFVLPAPQKVDFVMMDCFLATEATNRAENMCKRTASEGPKKQKNTIKNRIKKRSQIERRERKRRERQKQFERTRGRRNKMNGPQKKGMDGSTPRRSRASAHKTAVHTTRQSTHHPTKEQ
jgi:hypothetical protein